MEKKEAIQLIDKTFNARFDLEQYTLFMRNLLNDYDEEKERDWAQGNYIYEAYREHINRFKRLGVYTDPEGNEVELLVIETKATSKLERARTSLRNFVIKRLSDKNRDYALAAFYSKEDNGSDWRFSFIKIEHESYKDQKGKVKTKKDLTPAKRYSFLVGEHEQAHTAQKQLLPILQNTYSKPAVEDIESGFSIEKVTDEFFEQYKDLYIKLSEHFEADKTVQKILKNTEIDTARFTKKLLGQIVFLYFLQKKGWLGVPKNEAWGKGEKRFIQNLFSDSESKNKNFFNDYLKYLFYEALAKARSKSPDPAYYKRFDCKIPFLNGGLFEADYEWEVSQLIIPNELFRNVEKNKAGDKGTGVLDVFDRYNFTIKEDEPLEKEVAVDPEMLGKVFENMLEITERKSKGAFYTPREVVHYMCQESLIHYLNNAVNDAIESYQAINSDQLALIGGATNKKGQAKIELEHKGKILVPKDDIEIFIRKGFLATDNDQNIIEKGKETAAYKFQLPESIRLQADLLDDKLTTIKICDPAIGSGAFPVGLLHELVTAQKVLLPYLSIPYLNKKLEKIELEKADFEKDNEKYTYRIKRHAIQESIYGVDIDASAIDIARLRLWLSLIVDEDDFYSIEALPNLDYKIVRGNTLVGLPDGSMRDLKIEAELEKLKDKFFDITDEKEKKELRNEINKKIRQLLESAEQFAGYKIDFDFKLFFSEVWHYKNGFDIVIGNPPYVFTRDVDFGEEFKRIIHENFMMKLDSSGKKSKSNQAGKINLFAIFLLQGLFNSNNKGNLSFIIPNNILRTTSYDLIRKYMLKSSSIDRIVDLGTGVFKNVTASTIILSISNAFRPSNKIDIVTDIIDLENRKYNIREAIQSNFLNNTSYSINILVDDESEKVNKIIKKDSKPLGEFCIDIIEGIVAHKHLITEEETKNSFQLVEGKTIKRYYLEPTRKFIEWDISKIHRKRPDYLWENDKKILIQRISGGLKPLVAALDTNRLRTFASVNNLVLKEQYTGLYNFILCVINSDLINWYYSINFSNQSDLTVNISKTYLEILPVKGLLHQAEISIIADWVINAHLISAQTIHIKFFEELINSIIYEVYFPEEIKKAKKEIICHLGELKQLSATMSAEEKLAILKSEFNRLYDPNHPVRNNMETIDSVEEIRIVKEALK